MEVLFPVAQLVGPVLARIFEPRSGDQTSDASTHGPYISRLIELALFHPLPDLKLAFAIGGLVAFCCMSRVQKIMSDLKPKTESTLQLA
jgi:hypothetical protein